MNSEQLVNREQELKPGELDYVFYFGSFNPFHQGHLRVVEIARNTLAPKQGVVVVPTFHHIWNKDLTAHEHREAMVKATIAEKLEPGARVSVSTIERDFRLSGATIETLKKLQGQMPDAKFGIVMGTDVVETFNKWQEWEEVLKYAVICVIPRSETRSETVVKLPPELKPYLGKRVFVLDTQEEQLPEPVSATKVREEIKAKGSSEHVSPAVNKYIKEHGLY